jgi:hypothetical protein
MSDIENTNLAAHVSICQERYQALSDRFDRLETRISDIEQGIVAIRNTMLHNERGAWHRWDRLRDVILGILLAAVMYLATAAGVIPQI